MQLKNFREINLQLWVKFKYYSCKHLWIHRTLLCQKGLHTRNSNWKNLPKPQTHKIQNPKMRTTKRRLHRTTSGVKKVIESVMRILNKPLWREIETLDLYWFTQLQLHPILLYSLVKGFTNQNLITKQVLYSNLPLFLILWNLDYH